MRLRISIGSALIDWSGCDVTPVQVTALIDQLAVKAADLPADEAAEPESDKPPVGFTTITELDPDR